MEKNCSFISMPTKTCIRLQDKQQDHHCSQHSGMVQSTTLLPESNTVLPSFNSSTFHCLSKLNLTEPQWNPRTQTCSQSRKSISELGAPKGWILQGNLLRVLDVAKNKADRTEKPLRFKQSIAEPLNRTQLWMGLENITRHILISFVLRQRSPSSPVSHSCSSAQHSCHGQCSPFKTITDQQPLLWEDYLGFIPFGYPVCCSNKNNSTSIKQDLCRKTKLTEVQTIAEIKVSYANTHKITVHNREHKQWTWKTGH